MTHGSITFWLLNDFEKKLAVSNCNIVGDALPAVASGRLSQFAAGGRVHANALISQWVG
jgi:hypothetical protein